ncbi:FixH family protein [Frigidibacter oleivorans]|uniref:FixH family protein n=1 Tax=Frigidibacter oleivorans TaxID=2487129 RepID=UPI000F8F2B01|nr:FixH family protein [Frigidibacter oleivorans]
MTEATRGRPLTGRMVLAITVSAFALIISVNVFMAVQAVGTFPGLEVANSYVASQSFDADRAAQQALGWQVGHSYEGGVLTLVIRDAQGRPAPVAALSVIVGRTTHAREDRPVELTYSGGLYTAPLGLAPGAWLLHLEARAADGTAFRQRYDLMVPERAE